MAKFHHIFTLSEESDSYRLYTCDENKIRLDFISESCIRVALWKNRQDMLPTFCVAPGNADLFTGRDKLSTEGFPPCTPAVQCDGLLESFFLPCGVDITLNRENFLLEYSKNGQVIFADRKPLAYNLEGEFGRGSFHYVTRQEKEKIFGLGDKGGALNKYGRSFRIDTSDAMGYDAETSDPLYKHIPFYICENEVACYGIFYDTAANSYADFGREINNYYPPYKYFQTEDNCLVYYVFFGTKLSVLQQFARLCGKQPLPPKWSFDYCASTMAYTDAPDSERQFESFLEKLQEYDLPCSGFYLSSGYTSIGDRRYVFNWNRDKFPDPKQFVEKFNQHYIRIIPNIKPAFLQSHPLYDEIAQKGYFIKNADGSPFVTEFWDGLGSYLDFTNSEACDYWGEKVKESLLDMGMVCTWNDNNEFDIRDGGALAEGFGDGKVSACAIRSVLTYLMVASSYQAQIKAYPQLRPFLSTRSGSIAVRRLAQTWSGDNRTCFADLRYCHNIGLTMSLSGLYFYGHDLGGFHGEMPSRELLLRWLQHGVFEPRFTIHSWNADNSATMPWSYPDIIPAVKKLFDQRKRFLPYLYHCAYDAVENEIPLNAPLLLYYDDDELYSQNDCMMVGRDVLAAFAFDEGINRVRVYLPKDDNWYGGNRLYPGGTTVDLTIPPEEETPCFFRSGSIVPTDENGVVFTVYPLEKGRFTGEYFDDDGLSFAYQKNECVHLHFTVDCDADTVCVHWCNSGKTPFVPKLRLCGADSRQLIIKE